MRGLVARPLVLSVAVAGMFAALLWVATTARAGVVAACTDTFSFSSASYSVNEGQAVTITVQDQRQDPSQVTCASQTTVQYSTQDGTAHSPGDYKQTTGTLTFSPSNSSGTTTQTFQVQTVDNGTSTPDENFYVQLSTPRANSANTVTVLGSPQSATVTIHNVDKAPVATTESAKHVSSHGATLEGKVNPDGLSTTYYFQYGKTTSYGSQTSSKKAGAGSNYKSESAALTGLKPHTKYHYRIVATNSAGTTYGSDRTFTTSAGFAGAFAPGQTDRMGSSGSVSVRVTCPSGTHGSCTGTLRLTDSSGSVIGTASFKESAGATSAVHVALTSAGQALVRKHGKLAVSAVVRSHDAFGTHRRRTSAITILAPRSTPTFTG